MTKRKPTGQRVEDTDWGPSIGESVIKLMPQFTPEAMIRRAREIEAKERAWRAALGVPEGFLVPDKPAAEEGLRAEVAEISAEIEAITEARDRAPLGQVAESLDFHLTKLHQRRWRLWTALKVRKD
jgi:hypothetical protein